MSFSEYFPGTFGFFKWVDGTWICNSIKATTWVFPLTETIHILALAMALGAMLMINFRLLGIIRNWTPAQMVGQLKNFINIGIWVIIGTGIILAVAEPLKAYDNLAFMPKMILLALSVIYQYTLYPKAEHLDVVKIPIWGKLAALVSIGLWFSVGVMGRAIGFV
jgi:hypothetical protein